MMIMAKKSESLEIISGQALMQNDTSFSLNSMTNPMNIRTLFTICFSFIVLIALQAQQSESPKILGKDKLYEKSGGKGIVVVNATSINSENLDFSPAFYHDGLVFISSRKKGGFVDEKIGERFFQMYFTRLDPNGIPVKPENFSTTLNSQLHEGPVSFTHVGDKIYFTSNNQKKGVQQADATGRVRMKIYSAERGAQGWTNIRVLPFNSNDFSCMHPSLSRDGKKLYFSSDRPGGFGANDIWVSDWNGSRWGEPTNLGEQINSEGNEVFPFIHFSGYLFYSSDGLENGPGGLDIYAVNTQNLPEATPQILSQPFNSSYDDLGFIVDERGTKGFFSSDRPGGIGKDDIYSFESAYSLTGESEKYAIRLALEVVDEVTGKAIPNAAVHLLPKDAFGAISGETLYDMQVTRNEENKDDRLTLSLVRKKSLQLNTPNCKSDDAGLALGEMEAARDYLILVDKPGYVVRELDYTSPLRDGAYDMRVLLKPLNCFPIEGVVKNQKTGEAIARVPVVIEVPGQKEPIRLESDAQGAFTYCLPEAANYSLSANKDGYVPGRTRINTTDGNYAETRSTEILLLPFTNTPSEKSPEPLSAGSVIVLENLYYDYDKASLRPGSANELDVVFDLMRRYPEMEIELGAHTDCRGSGNYNQRLSESRAESARNYLIGRGIQPARIVAKGYGESQIRNQCQEGAKCSEAEHEYNRRTEIRITRLDQPVEVRYAN